MIDRHKYRCKSSRISVFPVIVFTLTQTDSFLTTLLLDLCLTPRFARHNITKTSLSDRAPTTWTCLQHSWSVQTTVGSTLWDVSALQGDYNYQSSVQYLDTSTCQGSP